MDLRLSMTLANLVGLRIFLVGVFERRSVKWGAAEVLGRPHTPYQTRQAGSMVSHYGLVFRLGSPLVMLQASRIMRVAAIFWVALNP